MGVGGWAGARSLLCMRPPSPPLALIPACVHAGRDSKHVLPRSLPPAQATAAIDQSAPLPSHPQGETWSIGGGGERYNRYWGENHFGDGYVQRFGHSNTGG